MAKTKGVQVIARRLVKYFPNKFSNYTSALPDARLVLSQIRDAGEKVNNKNIFSKIRTPRKPKRKSPILKERLGEPVDYFELSEYPGWISKCQNNLLFTSKLIPSSIQQPFPGGADYDYAKYFSHYVDYIDSMQKKREDEGKEKEKSGTWHVMCTPPIPYKNKKGFWITKIISVDSTGTEWESEFNPNAPTKSAKETIIPDETREETLKPKEVEVSQEDFSERIRFEQEKQKTLDKEMEYIEKLKSLGFTNKEIREKLK